jgi:hypothetical protein
MIAEWTNLGTPGGGLATMWAIDEAGYNDWLTLGGGLEANLVTYSTIMVTQTSAVETPFTFPVGNTYLQFVIGEGGSTTGALGGIYDELRFGTTLADVTIPEPGTAMLAAGGFLFTLLRRKRRRVS